MKTFTPMLAAVLIASSFAHTATAEGPAESLALNFADITYDYESSGDVVPTDTLSLNFGAIKFEYAPQKSDGTLETISINYDAVAWEYHAPHVNASFDAEACTLWVDADDEDDTIALEVDERGRIVVNEGTIAIDGGAPMVDDVCLISIDSGGGHDFIVDGTGLELDVNGRLLVGTDGGIHYFDGKFLRADDLTQEQTYFSYDGGYMTVAEQTDGGHGGWVLVESVSID